MNKHSLIRCTHLTITMSSEGVKFHIKSEVLNTGDINV